MSQGRQSTIDLFAPGIGANRTDPLFRSRAGALISDSIRNARITVALGDQLVPLKPSNKAGYFMTHARLAEEHAKQLARDGVITFESLPTPRNPNRFKGSAVLVGAEGLLVVTDMDDTIKDTNVRDHAQARANTLMRPFGRSWHMLNWEMATVPMSFFLS